MRLFLKNIKYLFTHDLSNPTGRISKSYLHSTLSNAKDFTVGGVVNGEYLKKGVPKISDPPPPPPDRLIKEGRETQRKEPQLRL